MMLEIILDVGSGQNPLPNAFHVDITRQAKHLDCLCDAHNLPFINKSFPCSRINHVLEHLTNPLQALEELRRVTERLVFVVTPDAHRACVTEDPTHLFSWTLNTLHQLLQSVFKRVYVRSDRGKGRNKLETVKLLLLSIISRSNELVAICEVEAKNEE